MNSEVSKKIIVLFGIFFTLSCTRLADLFPSTTDDNDEVVYYTSEVNQVGFNTWFLNDWDGSRAFADVIKHCRAFDHDPDWATNNVALDALGWPTADCSTVLFAGYGPEDSGWYHLVFQGQADVSGLWVSAVVSNQTYDPVSNITTCEMYYTFAPNATGGIVFRNTRLTSASPLNTGVRNIHLYRPGYNRDGSDVFTTPFINGIKKGGVIRTMEWLVMNQNSIQTWADRNTPLHAGFQKRNPPLVLNHLPAPVTFTEVYSGVAMEHIVQLCNTTGSDLWINIPPLADDDYVLNTARLLLYGSDGTNPYTAVTPNPIYPPLSAGLKVYVEYGNEIWNSAYGFDDMSMVRDLVWNTTPSHPVRVDGTSPADAEYTLTWRYTAFRLAEISLLFRQVFGDAAMMTRVRPLLMSQLGNGQGTLSTMLLWADDYYRVRQGLYPLSYLYWGAGGSAYYGVNRYDGSVNSVFQSGNYPDTNFIYNNKVDAMWCYNYGLKRVAYEGGIGMDFRDSGWNLIVNDSTARSANADNRMEDLIKKNHIAWSQTGGDLLVYYCLTGPSYWEFTPAIKNLNTPKMRAFDYIGNSLKARVTMGTLLPGTSVARLNLPFIRTGWGWTNSVDGEPCEAGISLSNMIGLSTHADAPFNGSLTVRGLSGASGTTLGVWVNGTKAGNVSLSNATHLTNSSSLGVSISEGLNMLRLEVLSGTLTLHSITVISN